MKRRLVHVIVGFAAIARSLSFLLRAGNYEVEVWSGSSEFLAGVNRRRPACILLIVDAGEITAQKSIAQLGIHFPIIVLTDFGNDQIAVQALRLGAAAFLEMPVDRARLIDAIQCAAATYEEPGKKTQNLREARAMIGLLTPGEREVLDGMASGFSHKTIASGLKITVLKFERRRANVLFKFKACSAAAALRIALDAKLGSRSGWAIKHLSTTRCL